MKKRRPSKAACPPSARHSVAELPTTVLVVRIDELKLIAERVADLPDLYERICRQMRAFDTFEDLDETPAHVLLQNVDGILVVSAITFTENIAADRFWQRSKADVRV